MVLLGVTSLIMASAGPAAAAPGDVLGENIGVGVESATEPDPDCIPIPIIGESAESQFDVRDVGTYDGVAPALPGLPPTTIASYVGDTLVQLQSDSYVISPEGTYDACPVTFPPPALGPVQDGIIGIQGTVTTPASSPIPDIFPGGSVTCANLDGEFTRRAFDVLVIVLEGACNVNGNVPGLTGSVEGVSTTHVITGVIHPCKVPVPPTDIFIPSDNCLTTDEVLELAQDVPNVTPAQVLALLADPSDDAGSYVVWNHVVLPV